MPTNRIGLISAGAAYGILLGCVAFLCAAFGHGTYLPTAVSSAPFGFFGIPAALFTAPLLWAILVFLLSESHRKRFMAAIIVHYASAGILLLTDYGDWSYITSYVAARPLVFFGWLAIYAAGQVVLWRVYRAKSIVGPTSSIPVTGG